MTWISFSAGCVAATSAGKATNSALVCAGPFCPGLARWRLPGRHKAKECHAGNIQTHGARRGQATGQDPIEAIKSLNGALFSYTKDRGVGRRLKVETDNVGGLGLEIRAHRWSCSDAAGTVADRHGHAHVADAQGGGKFARTPMRGPVGRFAMQGPMNNAGF
jgi:hypothetical protein